MQTYQLKVIDLTKKDLIRKTIDIHINDGYQMRRKVTN